MPDAQRSPARDVDRRVGDMDMKDKVCLVTGGGSGAYNSV